MHACAQNLDFDFEQCCSVSLSHVNVYACLVCGKYFQVSSRMRALHTWRGLPQHTHTLSLSLSHTHTHTHTHIHASCMQGRGLATQAYTHSLETGHHMFMKLDNGKVYCLPDNYEVQDRSLDDIRHMRDPLLAAEEVSRLDLDVKWARALDGTEYMPGLVGLNNMRDNDYANVVVHILTRVTPVRCAGLGWGFWLGQRFLLGRAAAGGVSWGWRWGMGLPHPPRFCALPLVPGSPSSRSMPA
jgi:U4/U6.U5 tri-snRNP-associated protein 2